MAAKYGAIPIDASAGAAAAVNSALDGLDRYGDRVRTVIVPDHR